MKKTSNHTSQSQAVQDEQYFADYLQGNSPLSAIYQQTDTPEPSADLDKSILSAAKNHATAKKVSHWWQQPGTWAASAAVFSLVGLLTLNTWQSEKTPIDKHLSSPAPAKIEADAQIEASALSQKRMLKKISNDTRKLIYKSSSAPVPEQAMQLLTGSSMAAGSKSETSKEKPQAEHYINKIKKLIIENKLNEARQQLLELQTKYPDQPVDPVILQQLSP